VTLKVRAVARRIAVSNMRKNPSNTIKVRLNKTAVSVFRVESGQPYGWIVYLDGFPTHLFVGRSLALMYACEWAKANAPSVIQVAGSSGQLEREDTYGEGKPPRFRPLVGRRLRETTHG
jgi:hypothetical protein